MSISAIIMMTIAIITVWGGLVAAIINIARHPEHVEHVEHVEPQD